MPEQKIAIEWGVSGFGYRYASAFRPDYLTGLAFSIDPPVNGGVTVTIRPIPIGGPSGLRERRFHKPHEQTYDEMVAESLAEGFTPADLVSREVWEEGHDNPLAAALAWCAEVAMQTGCTMPGEKGHWNPPRGIPRPVAKRRGGY